jgi:hypothetical protein
MPDGTEKPFGSGSTPDTKVTVSIKAPDIVGVGGTFPVGMRVAPAPPNGPIRLEPGSLTTKASLTLNGANPQNLVFDGGTNAAVVPGGAALTIPQGDGFLSSNATATAQTGQFITVGLGTIDQTGNVAGTVVDTRCSPAPLAGESAAEAAQVKVVAGTVTGVTIPGTTGSATVGTAKSATFATCAEARAAGRGVIPKSSPAYSINLDADKDGLACEANEGATTATVKSATAVAATTTASLALTGASSYLAVGLGALLLAAGVGLSLLAVHLGRSRARRTA